MPSREVNIMLEQEMISQLKIKQGNNTALTQEELEWLWENIGNPNPEIRDDLVFNLFGQFIFEQLITREQLRWMIEKMNVTNSLEFRIEETGSVTACRSFSALVMGMILQVDGDQTSGYDSCLTTSERTTWMQNGIRYLTREQDRTGYDEKLGWVHAFAHGADLLGTIISHPKCTQEYVVEALEVISDIFQKSQQPFIDEEEKRLGLAIFFGIESGNLSQKLLCEWMKKQRFEELDGSRENYYRLAMYKSFLATIYFRMESLNLWESSLKEEMMIILQEY
ncbi:DUF2785 domain-containing protein [Campylobacter coli]|nr:DUF2785 domain-containing protein [Campylobacter coli]